MPARPQRMRHVNGTAATAYTKIAVKRGIGQYAKIANLDGTNSLEVSFDGGTNYFIGGKCTIPLPVHQVHCGGSLLHYHRRRLTWPGLSHRAWLQT